MDKRTYYKTVSIVFGALAVLHAIRAYYGWEAQIDVYVVPVWYSWVAVAIAGYLSVRGWQFAEGRGR